MIGGPAVSGSGTPPSLRSVGQLRGPKNVELYCGQQLSGSPVFVVRVVVIWPPPAIGREVEQSGSAGFLRSAVTAATILTSVFAADAIAAAPKPVSPEAAVIVTVGAVQIPVGGVVVAMLTTEPVAESIVAANVPPVHVASEMETVGGSV